VQVVLGLCISDALLLQRISNQPVAQHTHTHTTRQAGGTFCQPTRPDQKSGQSNATLASDEGLGTDIHTQTAADMPEFSHAKQCLPGRALLPAGERSTAVHMDAVLAGPQQCALWPTCTSSCVSGAGSAGWPTETTTGNCQQASQVLLCS
jgi:hypothetical protein